MTKIKNNKLESICYGSSFPKKYVEFEFKPSGPRITCTNQYKPNGIGLGKVRESSSDIIYSEHCRQIAKWFNKAAKIMENRLDEKIKSKKQSRKS